MSRSSDDSRSGVVGAIESVNRDCPSDNPPSGAVIDYYLPSAAKEKVKLAIYDTKDQLVRELSSSAEPPSSELPPNVPRNWLLNPQQLPNHKGMNRVAWDLRCTAPPVIRHDYPISALYEETPGNQKLRWSFQPQTACD